MEDKTKQWINPLEQTINISVLTKILPKKGNLVYEYNPFRNYRLSKNMYEYQGQLYLEEQLNKTYNLYWIKKDNKGWCHKNYNSSKEEEYIPLNKDDEYPIPRMKGELVDFITDELSFDLAHPVTMIPQYSYDGSVNLILTDGKNQPKIINSRL